MKHNIRAKRIGLFSVTSLLLLTLIGHLATRKTSASPAPDRVFSSHDSLLTLSGKLDRAAVLKGGDDEVKLELAVTARETGGTLPRTPVDMIVVLDRSGSMGSEGKIEAARAAIDELITQLLPGDRLALVAFSAGAEVLIPMTQVPTSSETRLVAPSTLPQPAWRRLVAAITPGGGTNMSAGLDLALELAVPLSSQARRAGRLLLISDGQANQGDTTPQGLAHRATQASRRELVVSSIGVGLGFNEFLLSSLADAGTGNYYYAQDTASLPTIFASEFAATRETVVRSLAVTIEPGPGVEVVDAAGYPLERTGTGVTFHPGSLFAGQERRVWVTLRVPNGVTGEHALGSFSAVYTAGLETHTLKLGEAPRIACVDDREVWLAAFDRETWAHSVVEEDYSRLRQRVAGHVKEGRRDQALEEIAAYRTENQELNRKLESKKVVANLKDVDALEAEVDDAFTGEGQMLKQNVLSKANQAAGRDSRRAGSKKELKLHK